MNVKGTRMNQQKQVIQDYFQMWINRDFSAIDRIFDQHIFYRECYGACYQGINQIQLWLKQQLKQQLVLKWDIHDIYVVDHFYFVTWTFQAQETGTTYIFDGISKIEFSQTNNKIIEIVEYETKHDVFYPFNKNL